MKLPGLNIPSTGRYHARNLPRIDATKVGDSATELARVAADALKVDNDITSASGEAAKELASLRAKLEDTNTLPVEDVPEGIEYNNIKVVQDDSGEEIEVELPTVFTHDIADEMWATQSQQIIDRYASTISSREARTKFVNEMQERYVVPGTLAISGASATKMKAHNWAVAQVAIDEILNSGGPSRQREEQAYEILARQSLLGVNPQLIEQKRQQIGPKVDYIDANNRLNSASTIDEIDVIEAELWEGQNRLGVEARSRLSVAADKRRADIEKIRDDEKVQNEEDLTVLLIEGELTKGVVAEYLSSDMISQEVARTLNNALDAAASGGSKKASDPFVLSHWRKEITSLPYVADTGLTVKQKANYMKRTIRLASMGLDLQGQPLPTGPTVSGEDAFKLMKDIDDTVKRYTETSDYKDVWEQIKIYSRASDPLTGALSGNQAQIDSAIAFKQALDNYMNTYGIDADPNEFFQLNRQYFDPDKLEEGINQTFHDRFPNARQFMTVEFGGVTDFNRQQQAEFVKWLRSAVQNNEIDRTLAEEMSAYFMLYYRGRGVVPAQEVQYTGPLYEGVE